MIKKNQVIKIKLNEIKKPDNKHRRFLLTQIFVSSLGWAIEHTLRRHAAKLRSQDTKL